MTHTCQIIPFRPKSDPMDTVNRVLQALCVALNLSCIALSTVIVCCLLLM